jgi:toxin ParE1/3/4
MPRSRYSADAKRDLLDILEFITRSSGSQRIGLGFTASLRRKCADLAALPGQMGRPRPELGVDIRSFAFHGYVIVFRYADAAFEIVRIYEGHRDVDSAFDDDPK